MRVLRWMLPLGISMGLAVVILHGKFNGSQRRGGMTRGSAPHALRRREPLPRDEEVPRSTNVSLAAS